MILDIQLFILHFYGLVLIPIDLYILIRLELYCTPTTYTDPPMTYTNPPPLCGLYCPMPAVSAEH